MRLSTKVFLLSFVPMALLLAVGFAALRQLVRTEVKNELRASLRDTHKFVSRLHQNYELRNNRLLTVVAENPVLKAGFELVRLEGNSTTAVRTLADQLMVLGETLGFDLVAAAGPDGDRLAVTMRIGAEFAVIRGERLPALQPGFAAVGDQLYAVNEIPVNLGPESIGTLFVGRLFDLAEFTESVALLRGDEVVRSNLSTASTADLAARAGDCSAAGGCELTLQGDSYLAIPISEVDLGDGYVLLSLQSVDSAGWPIEAVVTKVFLAVGALAVVAGLLVSLASSRSIALPITVLIGRMEDSADSGLLPSVDAESSTAEIDRLIRVFNRTAASIREGRHRLTSAYREFVGSLAHAIDARNVYTAGHSARVSRYSCAIARVMEAPEEQFEVIRVGALLHDVGKIGIADTVLQKPAKLTSEEVELIRRHPLIGKRIIENVEGFAPYVNIVELHHENHDGSGYPRELRAAEIPLDARIVHVADAYDAMTSNRPYRQAMSHERAVGIIRANSGTQFDPEVVGAFCALDFYELLDSDEGASSGQSLQRLEQALNADAKTSARVREQARV